VAERMRSLHPGDWMRLTDEKGHEAPVKVAWISPLSGRLLLVNRRGMRQLVASPEQLASLVRSGHLFAEADDKPFDEAMRLVRQGLGRSGARVAGRGGGRHSATMPGTIPAERRMAVTIGVARES